MECVRNHKGIVQTVNPMNIKRVFAYHNKSRIDMLGDWKVDVHESIDSLAKIFPELVKSIRKETELVELINPYAVSRVVDIAPGESRVDFVDEKYSHFLESHKSLSERLKV